MPPVVAAAAVTGAAALGAGALNARGNSKAAKTQDAAAQRAEAIAIENEKRRREEYDRAEAASKAQWDAEQARLEPYRAAKNALLGRSAGRLGLSLGDLGGARGATPYPGSSAAAAAASAYQKPRTLADLAGQPYGSLMPEIQEAPRLTIADFGNWGSQRRAS